MINLLPPNEKNKLLLERKRKIITIVWFLLLVFMVCFIGVLFLAESCLKKEIKRENADLILANSKAENIKIKEIKKRLEDADSNFKKLESFYSKKIYFSDVLEKISQIMPEEIYLTGISVNRSLDKNKKTITEVSISGFSPTREILFKLKENFQRNKFFQEVLFPPSDWVKPTDIKFLVTFKLKSNL